MQAISSRSIRSHLPGALVLAGLFVVVGLAIHGYTQTVTSKKSSTGKKETTVTQPNRLQEDSAVFDVRFWLVLNTRTKPSKTVGTQLLAVLRALNTKVSFGVGYSEPSLMKHWLFFATASKRPNRMSCPNRFL
jgi:hypothetical protein